MEQASGPSVKPGVETSEHAQMKRADTWTTVLIAVGVAIDTLPIALENLHAAFPQAVWVGTAMTIVGLIAKVWNAIGYGRSRAAVKAAAMSSGAVKTSGYQEDASGNATAGARMTGGGALVVLLACLALPAFAQEAPEPRFGGCLEGHPGVCFAPTVSFNLMAMSLSTGDITTTFDVGPGYGVTFWSDKWHRLGISASASFPLYEGKRRIEPALVLSFAEFARIGLSCPTYVVGGFEGNARLLLSLGVNLWSW